MTGERWTGWRRSAITVAIVAGLVATSGLDVAVASVRRSHLEYARSLERKGALRAGITVEQAADYMLLGDPDRFLALRRDKGWSFDQCEAWLADVLTRLLLD